MTRNLKQKLVIATAGTILLITASSAAKAGTLTGSFAVTSSVAAACHNLTTNSLSFGAYSPLAQSDATASANLSVTCTQSTPFSLSLDAGTTQGATTAERLLVNADGATLSYNLYTSNSYTTVIDAENTLDGTGAGPSTAVTKTVYGKAPGGQDVAPGDYSDTITVTVSY